MKWKYLYSVLLILCCITILTSAVRDDKEQRLPHDYVLKTKEYFSKEEWEQGKKMLDEGLKIYPDDPDMRWLMGRYYYQYKDYDQSRYQLIKCIEKEYNHVEAKQLLVNVEDETKHYSSAICYVNELLEVNPYWRGLWRRKIELYRKQGNDIEADRLLKRISQIYPDDPTIRNDLNYTLETEYLKKKKSGNLKEATNSLEELIKSNPHSGEQYYFDLTNLYLQQGLTEKALEISAQGVQDNPTSTRLVTKKSVYWQDKVVIKRRWHFYEKG
jgi:tetratricopeptide (TPR) repeat protein